MWNQQNLLWAFLNPDIAMQTTGASATVRPPSQVLKEAFTELNGHCTDDDIKKLSKSTLLPPEEVQIWLEHLRTIQQNRKRGAEKAAATRRRKEKHYFCICGEEYIDVTDEVQHWIGCEQCNSWFHCQCVGIQPESIPDVFVCNKCAKGIPD